MTNLSSIAHAGTEPSSRHELILILSNDPDTRFLLRTLLGLLSYPTIEADSADDCVGIIDSANPGLLLMDVIYPLHDDLTLLSEKVKAFKTPVVLVSNYPQLKFRELEHKLNIHDHLLKPVSFTVLESCVKKYIPEKQTVNHNSEIIS